MLAADEDEVEQQEQQEERQQEQQEQQLEQDQHRKQQEQNDDNDGSGNAIIDKNHFVVVGSKWLVSFDSTGTNEQSTGR